MRKLIEPESNLFGWEMPVNIYACACVCVKHSFFFFLKQKNKQTPLFTYFSISWNPWRVWITWILSPMFWKWKWKSLHPTWLFPTPWNSPGQNTGVGSLSLLQGIFPTQGSNPGLPHCRWILYQLSHKRSPRIPKWVAYPFSRGSSHPRNRTRISCVAGRFFTNWTTRETQWAHQDSCFRLWQKPCHCFHEHELPFPRLLWFCLVCH